MVRSRSPCLKCPAVRKTCWEALNSVTAQSGHQRGFYTLYRRYRFRPGCLPNAVAQSSVVMLPKRWQLWLRGLS